MKLGCAVGCFTYPHYSAPYEDAIRKAGDMGFDGIELIVSEIADLTEYYTPARLRSLRELIAGYGMEVSELILYACVVQGFSGRDEARKQRSLDMLKRGIEIAQSFGTDKINMVSNWPDTLTAPISYPPCYFHPNVNGVERYEPKLKLGLPRRYDAQGEWENYIESLRRAVTVCEAEGMMLCLEGHANVIIGSTDGFLRACDWIESDAFCTNFDTAWQLVQREYLPWSIYKLGDRIRHVHVRDGDGMLCYTLPPGQGIIDWHGLVRALDEVGYDGYLSFELGGMLEPSRCVQEGYDYLLQVLLDEKLYTGKGGMACSRR